MQKSTTITRRHLTAGLAALPVAGAAAFAGDRAIAFGGTPSFEEFATAFRELDPRIKRLLLLMTREYEVDSSPEWDKELFDLMDELHEARARYDETSAIRSRAEDAYHSVTCTRPNYGPVPDHVIKALASIGLAPQRMTQMEYELLQKTAPNHPYFVWEAEAEERYAQEMPEWEARRDRAREETGVLEAERADNEALDECWDLLGRILDTRARTISGMVLKGEALEIVSGGPEATERLANSLFQDQSAMLAEVGHA